MYTFIRKKIIKYTDRISNFARDNLTQIVIIGGLFIFLEIAKSLPYVNIIPSYQFLVIGFIIFLTVVLFRVAVPNKNLVLAVLILFGVAAITTIFEMAQVSEIVGFIIFVLLAIVIVRQFANDREKLKKVDSE